MLVVKCGPPIRQVYYFGPLAYQVEWGKSAGIKVPYLYRNVAIFVFCFLPSSGATKGLAEWIINAALTFIVL